MSARPFVGAAAAAGYQVTALDAFADMDTQRLAHESFSVECVDGHFDAAGLERALSKIDLGDQLGFVYGSGFEAAPELLETVVEHMPLIGNTPIVIRNLKRPRRFFMLLDILKIPHPEVSFKSLSFGSKKSAAGWFYKQGSGSGGTHIRKALPLLGIAPEVGHYFQREVQGVPVSLLFVADSRQAWAIGYNQQWLSPTPATPYRYGGAVSHAVLPDEIKRQLLLAAYQLTNAVGLRGINSLDAIMDGDQLWVLELNPRLSATFDLYQTDSCNLFELHLQASAGDIGDWPKLLMPSLLTQMPERPKAHYIVYLPYDLAIADDMNWPEWAADLPLHGSHIAAGAPVCTVLAEGDSAEAAQSLVLSRAASLEKTLEDYKGKV